MSIFRQPCICMKTGLVFGRHERTRFTYDKWGRGKKHSCEAHKWTDRRRRITQIRSKYTHSHRHAQSLIVMMTHIVRARAVHGAVDFVINAITNTQHPFGGKFSSRVERGNEHWTSPLRWADSVATAAAVIIHFVHPCSCYVLSALPEFCILASGVFGTTKTRNANFERKNTFKLNTESAWSGAVCFVLCHVGWREIDE